MATQSSEPSRRKHHRTASEEDNNESENYSKRRKHRHHRHHKHHHRHRHHDRSSKEEGKVDVVTEPEVEVEEGRNDENGNVGVANSVSYQAPAGDTSGEVAPVSLLGIDYDDMEEGEIVEEENEAVDTSQRKGSDSCFPSNESIDEGDEKGVKDGESGMSSKDDKDFVREKHKDLRLERSSRVEHVDNGEVMQQYWKDELPREEYSQKNGNYNIENSTRDKRADMFTEDGRKKHTGLSSSPSQDTYHGQAGSGSCPKSPDPSRGRSRSQSVLREDSLANALKADKDGNHLKQKLRRSDSDDEMVESSRDYRRATEDFPGDKERERSALDRPASRADTHRENQGRDREGSRDLDRDRTRESQGKYREGSRDLDRDRTRESQGKYREGSRDLDRDRTREIQGKYREGSRDLDRDWTRENRDKYREGSRDLDRDRTRENRDKYREGSRDLERDRTRESQGKYREGSQDLDRDRTRETRDKYREGSRDLDRDRTKERDRMRAQERERDRNIARDRERERERERERYRDWEREKERESRRKRDRESSRDRYRDRDDKYSRHSTYNDDGDLGRHDDYRRRRLDETSNKDRLREGEAERANSSKANLSEKESEKSTRDEKESEDYQEKVVLQLAEQEEDDLEKIKEESRRRRQAILEKYKTQNLQQEKPSQPEHTENDQIEQPPLGVVCETTDDRTDGMDDDVADLPFSVGKSPPPNGISALEKPSDTGGLGAGTPKSERSSDMFCDDIFGESPAGVRRTGKGDGLAIERSGQHDNWDDPEGYYSYRFGEILDGRYEIIAAHGKGVFSTVVRAKDLKAKLGDPEEVAIKIIRSNETMYKAGMEELVILKKLVGADPENKRHCVRFLSSFKYRNHLCLVFESLHMNLREVLKKFGRYIGLHLTAVRSYAKQLFIALKHLKNCGVLHCDIKPDNMLVNEAKNVLKLCDFGNAMFAGKNEVTPYLVSRFYRAPEIILGLAYDHPMDMWSVGCCLFEIYTGKVLFPGPTNNDMLRLQMELKGLFPKKMVRKGAFKDQHFDTSLNFIATEEDPVTKKAVRRAILNVKPKDFGTLILGSPGEDPKMLANFKDLLEKIFMLDPDKRITVSQALSHPFITGK